MAKKKKTLKNPVEKNRCGLCGKTRNLTKTECCDNWICDDEDKYVMFSYARNSCHRNPIVTPCAPTTTTKNMTAIGNHVLNAGAVSLGRLRLYGTNECNFEKLPDPPAYEPTRCSRCATVIVLSEDEYSQLGKDYFCSECTDKRITQRAAPTKSKRALPTTLPQYI